MGSLLPVGFGFTSLVFFLQLVVALALPLSSPVWERSAPIYPSDDPFYSPPDGYESSAPGTILRSRTVPNPLSLLTILPINIQGAYQLLYRTTDSLGNAQAAVTTVIVPHNADTTKLLSYQFAEDAAWVNCAPSYAIQEGAEFLNTGSSVAEILLVIAALNQGWIVNTPDYEGPQAAFTSGIQAGQATLDSIRAALASGDITGVSSSATYQMWGYSGGSLASEWAAELQPTYAPELNFAGVALNSLVPNITTVLTTINKGPFAGFAPAGFLGLASAYPDLAALINDSLIPSKADDFYRARTQCLDKDILDYAGQDIFSYFEDGDAFLSNSIPHEVLAETGIMGTHGTPQMPMFIVKAVADEVSVVADTDALVKKLCSQGAQIQYVRDGLGEHVTELITGAGDAMVFLKNRFDGIPADAGCSTTNVLSATLNLEAIEALGLTVVEALLAILALPIGEIGLRYKREDGKAVG
ncbi:hypothetical protein VE03_09340 [Pseudogymnoascus sp. 23342-1-I1]|nr:hypothetical protein VE03_09340 [Pseudogymnoascus sp. 23342-1-I1]